MKCIDVSNFDMTYPEITVPMLNETYTIREIIGNPDLAGSNCYRFQEIVNPVRAYQRIQGAARLHSRRAVFRK